MFTWEIRVSPVFDRRGKYSIATRRLGGTVERVGGRAPDGAMGCGPVRLQRSLVPVNFEGVVNVLVLLVVKNVEAQAAWLIPLGASTSIALRNRSRSSGLTWTFTHSASMRTSL